MIDIKRTGRNICIDEDTSKSLRQTTCPHCEVTFITQYDKKHRVIICKCGKKFKLKGDVIDVKGIKYGVFGDR